MLNQDYLQNATFICAAPSMVIENRAVIDDNMGIVQLKELLMTHLVPASFNFEETKKGLAFLNKRILTLEQNYENAFLVASGDTLKDIHQYTDLRRAVEEVIQARNEK